MADNYLQFSTIVPCETEEQQTWLMERLVAQEDEYICEFSRDDADRRFDVWVYADEGGQVEYLADIVCEFQTRFSIDKPWSLEFAETCSKPRLDEFSGGAVVCCNGAAYWMHTTQWVEEKIKELTAASS